MTAQTASMRAICDGRNRRPRRLWLVATANPRENDHRKSGGVAVAHCAYEASASACQSLARSRPPLAGGAIARGNDHTRLTPSASRAARTQRGTLFDRTSPPRLDAGPGVAAATLEAVRDRRGAGKRAEYRSLHSAHDRRGEPHRGRARRPVCPAAPDRHSPLPSRVPQPRELPRPRPGALRPRAARIRRGRATRVSEVWPFFGRFLPLPLRHVRPRPAGGVLVQAPRDLPELRRTA
jgi:hypothetical protein